MALKIPKAKEIHLKKPPLDEVIFQVKYPPILRIFQEMPVEFQEAIRGRFPGLEVEHGIKVLFSSAGNAEKPAAETMPKIFRFYTADRHLNVALAADFLAISTNRYSRWQDFKRDLGVVEETFRKIFQPAYATRIGLRFVNRFTRVNTGSQTMQEVLSLFRSELVGLIQTDGWDEPDEVLSQVIISDQNGKLALRTGYGKDEQGNFFLLDFDYFEDGQKPLDGLLHRVGRYHTRIYDTFRWCLKESSLERFQHSEGG